MILNINEACAQYLLRTVDYRVAVLLKEIPKTRIERAKDELIIELKWDGIVKHRLHYGLGLPPFKSAVEWGYPRTEHPRI